MDSFDPLNGWPITVITTPSIEVLSPKNDVYGLLYYYLFDHLANFHKRLTSSENNAVHFTLLSCDAKNISNVPGVVTHSFDLIDVSNITDLGYLGVETTLFTIAKPLLKPDGQLITLFMNYIVDLQLQNSSGWEAEQTKTMLKRVTNFLSPGEMMEHFGPLNMLPYRFMNFMDTLKEHDKAWTGYLRTLELEMTAKHMGMKTVKMEKPYRFDVELNKSLRSRFKEIKAILMDRGLSGISGHEVYVVWAKDQ